jgi:nitroreductase
MPPAPRTDLMRTLAEAARLAQRAPSVFNTQPWRWRIRSHSLDLLRDPTRTLGATDPAGHQLLMSCGAALHHARLALAAAGRKVTVARFPDPAIPELVARLDISGRAVAEARIRQLRGAIPRRRTDRRAFGATPVPGEVLARLGAAARAEGADLYPLRAEQVPALAAAAAEAARAERADAGYRATLAEWTGRPSGSGDGVPATTAVPAGSRPVPIRDFTIPGHPGLAAGPGHDEGTAYVILHGMADTEQAWLCGGEALSAVLLTAVLEGLAVAPMSDVFEVEQPRRLVQGLLPRGVAYLVLRIGMPTADEAPPPSPRRRPAAVIEFPDPRDG